MKNGFFKYVFASMLGFIFAYIAIFIVATGLFLGIVGVVASKYIKDGKEKTLTKESVLFIELNTPIVERTEDNPFESVDFFNADYFPQELRTVLQKIRAAKDDDKISAIYLNLSMMSSELSTLNEIRNALIDFKTSGKKIYAYSDLMTQGTYYLSSVADKIYIQPEGMLLLNGFNSEMVYLKGMFDKLSIQPKLFRAGDYKSAGEMFTRENMSEADRQQLEEYIFPIYTKFLKNIASSRNLKVEELKRIFDEFLIRKAEDALEYKLVDGLMYRDEFFDLLKKELNVKKLHLIKLNDYTPNLENDTDSDNKIAVIYAVGSINMGEGSAETIGDETLCKALRKARTDKDIKAIVLRINSPGGNSLPSDNIWREVKLAAKEKPFVVSMGNLAASGGYYIACPADTIITEPFTITGSIGVFGVVFNLQDFWKNKTGIAFDRVKTSPYADFGNPNRPILPEEELIIQSFVDDIYVEFKKKVSEGRGLDINYVDSIARGRIWSGEQAVKNGLADLIGNLDDAIRIAAEMADIKDYELSYLPKKHNPFSKFLHSGKTQIRNFVLRGSLGEDYDLYKSYLDASNIKSGVYMLSPQIDIK